MAWTAQAGLGPRAFTLCLKVFVVLMFYSHDRRGIICNAMPKIYLPPELLNYSNELIMHFCPG